MSDDRTTSFSALSLRGFAWLLAGSSGQALVSILVTSVLARVLTPTDFGVFVIAISLIGFAQVFVQLGLAPALVRHDAVDHRHVGSATVVSLIAAIAFAALVVLFRNTLADFFGMPKLQEVLPFIALIFPISALTAVSVGLLQRMLRFRAIAIIDIFSYATSHLVLGIGLAFSGYGIWSLVFANIGAAVLRMVFSMWAVRHSLSFRFDKEIAKELFDFGGAFSLAQILNYFASQLDNLVVSRMGGAVMAGHYSRSYSLMMSFANVVVGVGDKVLFPILSQLRHDMERLRRGVFLSVGVVLMCSSMVSAVLIVVAPEVVTILLGKQWNETVFPFQILTVFLSIRCANKIGDTVVRTVGAVRRHALTQAFYALSVFLGSLVGFQFGLPGVAAGVGLSIAIYCVCVFALCAHLLNIRIRDFLVIFLRHGVIAGLIGLFSYIVRISVVDYISANALIVCIVVGLSAMLTWFCMIALLPLPWLGAEGAYVRNAFGRTFRRLVRN